MGTRGSSWWRRMRIWAPAPAALVLASLLLVGSSWADVAHGVRTTPHAYAPTGGDADGGVLDAAEVPPAVSRAGAGREAYKAERDDRTEDEAAAGSSSVLVEEEEQGALRQQGRVATGSRPPDCAHACGPCSPCRRVMVSFRCVQASESCPVAYRCMCRGRFFRVPSL